MPCKHCGTNWKKDVTTSELKEELALRKAHAIKAREEYVARMYPGHRRDGRLTIVNFLVAIVGGSLLTPPLFNNYIGPHFGTYQGPVALLFAAFMMSVLFLPACYFIRKERRTYAGFFKEHPLHAEALQDD